MPTLKELKETVKEIASAQDAQYQKVNDVKQKGVSIRTKKNTTPIGQEKLGK